MSNNIYLDNASTTKPSSQVIEKVIDETKNSYANPSSLHGMGLSVEKKIKEAKVIFAKYLGANPQEIYFTSGGTESNNLAIQGAFNSRLRTHDHIITAKTEHPSVLSTVKMFEQKGYEIEYVNVDKKGYIDKEHLSNLIKEKTAIISIMDTNNETGTIQDINSIGKLIKEKNNSTVFHVDGVQAFGKKKINLKYVDLFSFSGHKIHATKGVGGLYVRKGTKLNALLFGGDQQNAIRPGTENTVGILAFAVATQDCYNNMEERHAYVKTLRSRLLEIKNKIELININGDEDAGSPYILNVSFLGVKGEVLLHSLEQEGIYVGTGSACSSKSSHNILSHMGHADNIYSSAIRFSFSHENTLSEVDTCINSLQKSVEFLRKFTRK